jgi:Rho GTPase-activating protein 11
MANGKIGEVPKVVSTCCRRLTQDLEMEGLFRKNGNIKKQKSIVEHLEKFGTLDRSHNAIDVANILKSFFRFLPVPLIPHSIQEPMIKCLSLFDDDEMKSEVILLLLLLLPPITLNTLAYFLQFIKTVVRYSNKNLMTSENLVKVLTPTLVSFNL